MNKVIAASIVLALGGAFLVAGPGLRTVETPAGKPPSPTGVGDTAVRQIAPEDRIVTAAGRRSDGCEGKEALILREPLLTEQLGLAIRQGLWDHARQIVMAGADDPPGLTAEQLAWIERQRLSLRLYRAAEAGDLDRIAGLVEQGADVNFETAYGLALSPLARAAICDQPAAIEALLAHGADPNLPLYYEISGGIMSDSTALIWASSEGSTASVRALLDAGANVNSRECAFTSRSDHCRPGQTALDVAKTGKIETLLIRAGAKRGRDLPSRPKLNSKPPAAPASPARPGS